MLRAENFEAPSRSQAAAGVTYGPSCRGSGGPIHVQYDPAVYVLTLDSADRQDPNNP